jgi:hypothetical protein
MFWPCAAHLQAKLAKAITGRLTNFAVLQLRHFTAGHDRRDLKTFAPGIFTLPELANSFSRFIQSVTICEQRHQFNGAKEFNRIDIRFAQWLELSCGDEQGDIFRGAVQLLRHLCSCQSGRQIQCRPRRHCRRY